MSELDKSILSTPFSPNPFNPHLTESLRGTPRYLFRVSDPLSPGTTNQTEVCSAAAQNLPEQPCDLYQMPPQQAAQVLDAHLWWKCSASGLGPCNLVSWTSSLLVALQYGFYCHGREWSSQELSRIKILMVDTRQFDCNMFARDLQVLAAFHGVSEGPDLKRLYEWRDRGFYYSGEYFSQGRLVIDPERSCQVSMEELVDRGLFNICPGLHDETHWSQWIIRVNELRSGMEPQLPRILAMDVQAAINVAKAFEHFELPAAIMLLSISPYDLFDGVSTILKVLLENYSEKAVRQNVVFTRFIFGTDTERLPEVVRWRDLHICIEKQMTLGIDELRQEAEEADTENDKANTLPDDFAGLNLESDRQLNKIQDQDATIEPKSSRT